MKLCSKCNENTPKKGGRYCLGCHAAYCREWRKSHRLNAEQKKRASARSYLKVYVKRGKIARQPCLSCGAPAEGHHPDYDRPLYVLWLCREHHMELHRTRRDEDRQLSTARISQETNAMRQENKRSSANDRQIAYNKKETKRNVSGKLAKVSQKRLDKVEKEHYTNP